MSKEASRSRGRTIAMLLSLFICLLIGGCAQHSADADQDRHSGIYGGISGGMQ